MLDRLRIRNYRLFRELAIPRLSRVNLIAGGNNAGKTALLEAVFLLSGAGDPHFAMNGHILRTAGAESEETTRSRTDRDAAVRLGALRKRRQGDVLLEALQVIEPRLRSVEDNSASGSPMIWGDIGLSELVPLAAMGEGMTRFANTVLAMANVPAGVMLIDEVENGIHHSVLADIWRVIDDASRRFGVQVFATTHSFECVQAADQAIKTDALSLHRLARDDDGNCRCVTYDRAEIAAALRHDIEVR